MLTSDHPAPDIATSSDDYATRFTGPVGQYLLETQNSAVKRVLAAQAKPLRILEVGGGHCQLTPLFLNLGHQVVMHGSSTECFNRAKSLNLSGNPKLSFIISPLSELPFDKNEFDVAVGIRLLAHMENWKALLAEMSRVCRYQLIFDFANLYTLNFFSPLLFNLKKYIEKNTRTYFCQASSAVTQELKNIGYNQIQFEAQFCCPMGLHRMLKNVSLSQTIENLCQTIGLTNLLGSPIIVGARKNA